MDINCPGCGKQLKLRTETGRVRCPHCSKVFNAESFGQTDVMPSGGAAPSARDVPVEAETGKDFAGYRILGELGRGGMGVVYKAYDPELQRTVALKVLLSAEHASADEVERFFREASSAARLQHPNIVPIHELKVHQGRHYYTMDLIDGQALDRLIAGRELSVRRGVEIIEKVARAVGHAHAQGIVHRDLKPGNVIVTADGEPKVTDFGLAKFIREGGPGTPSLTRTGFAMGTPEYMAPEQAAGRSKEVDARADVYALGCMLYEILAGAPPFSGSTAMEVLQRHLDADPAPPSRTGARVAEDLETICLKCLEKEPARRYPQARALAEDLRCFLDGEPVAARRASVGYVLKRKLLRHRVVAAVVAVAACALVALTAWYVLDLRKQRHIAEQGWQEAETAKAAAESAKGVAEKKEQEAKSEKERFEREFFYSNLLLARVYADEANIQRLDQALDVYPAAMRHWEWGRLKRDGHQELATLCQDGREIWSLALSADGQRLAISGNSGTVRVLDYPSGRQLHALGVKEHGGQVTFSPDGKQLLFWGEAGDVRLWETETGKELYSGVEGFHGHEGYVNQVNVAAFSRDGKLLATGGRDQVIRIRDAHTGKVLKGLHENPARIWGLDFSPDGKLLAVGYEDKAIRIWDHDSEQVVKTLQGRWGFVTRISYTRDGKWLVFCTGEGEVMCWEVGGSAPPFLLGSHQGKAFSLHFSPDEKLLVTCGMDRAIRVWEFPSGREFMTLKGHIHAVCEAVFTPDGTRLVSGGWDRTVRTWDAQRSRSIMVLRGHTDNVWDLAFSPDGKLLASAGSDQVVRIWEVATGHELRQLQGHENTVYGVNFSPDGKLVATTGADGTVRLWEAEAGRALVTTKGHQEDARTATSKAPVFSPNGKMLATAGYVVRLWEVPSGRPLRKLDQHPFTNIQHLTFSPDGKLLAASGGEGFSVWEAETGKHLRFVRTGPNLWVIGLKFSPDGRSLAGTVETGDIRVWEMPPPADPATPVRELLTMKGHAETTFGVAYSPDGKRLASGSVDGTVGVWDTSTGRELLRLAGHRRQVGTVAFSPDGRILASGSHDKTVRLWFADDWTKPGAHELPKVQLPPAPAPATVPSPGQKTEQEVF